MLRRRRQHQCACDVDLYRRNWRGAEFLQQGRSGCRIWTEIRRWAIGVMGSVSVNRQVGSYFKYSYIPPYNDSPFFSLNPPFPSHLLSLTCQCFSFFFFYRISTTFMEHKLRSLLPRCAPPRSLRQMSCLGLVLNGASICCLICQPT